MIESGLSTSTALLLGVVPMVAALLCGSLLLKVSGIQRILFVNLFVMNFAQGIGYLVNAAYGWAVPFFADLYLIALYFFFTNILLYTIERGTRPLPFSPSLTYLLPVIISILHAMGLIADGYREDQYTLMHYDGPLAPLADVFMLSCILGTFWYLHDNVKNGSPTDLEKSKNLIFAASFILPFLTLAIIVVLSFTPFAWSIAFASPIVTLWASGITLYLARPTVANVTLGLPWVKSRWHMIITVVEAGKTGVPFSELGEHIHKLAITEAIEAHERVEDAAEYAGYPRSTFYRQVKQLREEQTTPEDND